MVILPTRVDEAARLNKTAPAGGGPAPGVLDANALACLSALDPTGENRLLERVLKAYRSSAGRLLPQLHGACRDHNLEGVRYVAHTLKSSSSSIGAFGVAARCAEVEAMTRSGRTQDMQACIGSMCTELEAVLAATAHLLDLKS